MLRSILITPDAELTAELQRALADVGLASVARVIDHYPSETDLARICRAHAPQVVFVGIDSIESCATAALAIERIMAGCQVIAVGRSCDADTLMRVMRAGIREFLAYPFERKYTWECLTRAAENLNKRPVSAQATDHVYSFLPAKPGVGATTLAMNASMAAKCDGGILLVDFDLSCGMLRFLMKLTSTNSVVDALQHATNMDEQLWPQLVSTVNGMDVLHAGRSNPDLSIQPHQIRALLEFARRNYKIICADLSGNIERHSIEVMHESKKIFLVCTPEVAALHLAREKMQYLQSMDLGDRVSLLLNRHSKRSELEPSHVEELVGAPIEMTFPNDYARVTRAIQEGRTVDGGSELGRQCGALAEKLGSLKIQAPDRRRRFVEYFTLTPARFTFDGRQ